MRGDVAKHEKFKFIKLFLYFLLGSTSLLIVVPMTSCDDVTLLSRSLEYKKTYASWRIKAWYASSMVSNSCCHFCVFSLLKQSSEIKDE